MAVIWGFNSRLDNIQASIADIKLKKINKINKKFIKIAEKYNRALAEYVQVPKIEKNRVSVFHRYIIKTNKRNRLMKYLEGNNIETKIHYPIPLHLQIAAKKLNYKKGSLPNVEKLSKQILSLPIYPEITEKQQNYVINNIKDFLSNEEAKIFKSCHT